MILVVVEALPVGSKPPAAVSVRISTVERPRLWRRSAYVDQNVIPARESGRFSFHAETGQTYRAGLDPFCRTAIPMLRLNCSSGAPRALASLFLCWHVCLHGKTWLPSNLLEVCWSWSVAFISTSSSIIFSCLPNISSKSRYKSASMGWLDPNSSYWGTGPLPSGTALLHFRGMLGWPSTSRNTIALVC